MELDERRVPVSELSDEELTEALAEHGVGLTPYEARRVAELIGHDPTLTEVHIFNVEWSELLVQELTRITQPAAHRWTERASRAPGRCRNRPLLRA